MSAAISPVQSPVPSSQATTLTDSTDPLQQADFDASLTTAIEEMGVGLLQCVMIPQITAALTDAED